MSAYGDVYGRWLKDPDGFWAEAAQAVDWIQPWHDVIDAERKPFYRWFTGGLLNTCFNAVDRHVLSGRADQAALIYDSGVTGEIRTFSYRELRTEVARAAGGLRQLGVDKGDRVLIFM